MLYNQMCLKHKQNPLKFTEILNKIYWNLSGNWNLLKLYIRYNWYPLSYELHCLIPTQIFLVWNAPIFVSCNKMILKKTLPEILRYILSILILTWNMLMKPFRNVVHEMNEKWELHLCTFRIPLVYLLSSGF